MSLNMRAIILVVAFLGIYAVAGAVASTEVWVDASKGVNGNTIDCGSTTNPCGTIRYAMNAHKNVELDVVLVSGGVFNDPEDIGLHVTAQNVSFRASNQQAPTVIDCEGRNRFINVTNHDLSEHTVLTLGLHAITFENCVAPGIGDGGAVVTSGIVFTTVTDCHFSGNAAMHGGAIAVLHRNNPNPIRVPVLTVGGDNGFTSNRAIRHGGAIHAHYGKIFVSGTHFENNTAGTGGAICSLTPYELTAKSSTFRNNSASNNGADGGNAIYAAGVGYVSIEDVTFTGNRGPSQGTVAFVLGIRALIMNSLFEYNRAGRGGGAIYGGPHARLSISDVRFIANSGTRGGALQLQSGHIDASGLTFNNNSAAFGGSIYFTQSDSKVINSSFNYNYAQQGAATYATVRSEIKFKSNSFISNTASTYGGAIYCDKSTYYFQTKQTFLNNTAGGATKSKPTVQDVFCNTAEAIGYCFIEGDQHWVGKCVNEMDSSPKIPIPKWLIAVFAGLGAFVFLVIVAVAFWMYRVKRAHQANMENGIYEPVGGGEAGESLLDDGLSGHAGGINDDIVDIETGHSNPFDVITNPNRVQNPSNFHHQDPDIDSAVYDD